MNSVSGNLWEWLAPIEADERFALCMTTMVVGLTALVFMVGLISHAAGKIHRTRLEAGLKRELLDRGMSAEEIARIVEASASSKGVWLKLHGCGRTQETKNVFA